MNIKTLIMLYETRKYRNIINIINRKNSITDDEYNIFLLSAVQYGLKWDYIGGIEKCKETEYFLDINKFKHYILTLAINKKLIPVNNIPVDHIYTNDYIINFDNVVLQEDEDAGIIKLGIQSRSNSPYFISQKNKLLNTVSDLNKLSIIFSYCITLATSIGDFDGGLEALNFFKNNMSVKTKNIDMQIVFFINKFIKSDVDKLQINKELFKFLLNLDDFLFTALLDGYLTQVEFTEDTIFTEKIDALERFKLTRKI